MAKMKPSSLAVFNSNDVFTTGADSTLPFTQNRDLRKNLKPMAFQKI